MAYQNILLIDDDVDDREIFMAALKSASAEAGFNSYQNAAEALTQLAGKKITTDIIFLDLNMPVMNGGEFLFAIKKHHGLKDIPVVVLSTSSQPEMIRQAMALGAKQFITKPDRFSDLVQILNSFVCNQD
jgi:CheY-like chemotaxis protein